MVTAGPGFDLHHLNLSSKTNIKFDNVFGKQLPAGSYQLGHFHSPKYTDILRWDQQYGPIRIYWADEQGNYDSAHYTNLLADSIHPGIARYGVVRAYATKLSQDSVEDVVLGHTKIIFHDSVELDTNYLSYYQGGTGLFHVGTNAFPDSSLALTEPVGGYNQFAWRAISQGDWRGVGRDDLIGGDGHGNLFHYANDPPFSLSRLRDAMLNDTLWLQRENPTVVLNGSAGTWAGLLPTRSYRALPKTADDRSEDWVISLPTKDSRDGSFFFFQGGKNFGKHRITIDSARYIPNPQPGTYWGYLNTFIPKMAGTDDPVMFVLGSTQDGRVYYYYFYVLGNSFDQYVDMFYSMGDGSAPTDGGIATLDADGDGFTDLILGMPFTATKHDQDLGRYGVGSIQVVHGSKKIPVHSRKVLALVEPKELRVYPNPASKQFTVEASVLKPGSEVVLYDLLGRSVVSKVVREQGTITIPVAGLSLGVYQFEVLSSRARVTTKVSVVK